MNLLRQAMLVGGIVLVALPLAWAFLPRGTVPGAVAQPVVAPVGKRIALSFDDVPRGPGAFYTPSERTARLIAALRTSGVEQAAFFANPGGSARPTMALRGWRRMRRRGMWWATTALRTAICARFRRRRFSPMSTAPRAG